MISHSIETGLSLLQSLSNLHAQKVPLTLGYTYKGVPLTEQLRIISVIAGRVRLHIPNLKICAVMQKRLYLHSPFLPQAITGLVAEMNLAGGWMTLERLAFTGAPWRERYHDRVQPDGALYLLMRIEQQVLRACLDDISVDGAAVLLVRSMINGLNLQPGIETALDLRLPSVQGHMVIRGAITNLSVPGGRLIRVGMQLLPSLMQARAIELYLQRRKQEILLELDERSLRFSEPRATKDLYF